MNCVGDIIKFIIELYKTTVDKSLSESKIYILNRKNFSRDVSISTFERNTTKDLFFLI